MDYIDHVNSTQFCWRGVRLDVEKLVTFCGFLHLRMPGFAPFVMIGDF
jgi:hypothetical protein